MNFMAILPWLLANFMCSSILADRVDDKPKIDLSQLEFENLESKVNRDEFEKNLDSYEITYPIALEKEYTLNENHRRLRRNVDDDRISYYQINAFGKTVELELENSGNILPGASVEYHKSDGIQKKLLSHNSCFKVGKVTNVNKFSSAAISDCDGLAGLVKTEDDLFFIEPMRPKSNETHPSLHRPHLVYRTKDLPSYSMEEYVNRTIMDNVLQAPLSASVHASGNRSSRVRRDAWDSFITVVNKAGRSIQLHWLDLFGRRRYFVTLEPNRKRSINTYAQTKWVAIDDSTQNVLFLNKKKEFLTRRNSESNRDTIIVTSPDDVEKKAVTSNKLRGEEHWIEALIIADESIVGFHGKHKVEKYLLILSNMISHIMKDPSIGVRLNFVLTRLVILQKKDPNLTIYKKNPSASVRSACNYAMRIQKSTDDAHKDHHDFALILTKHKFGPAGYAPVYTMCTRRSSCALVDDSGFAAAFIAAHEAGHTLGLGHDGDENDCKSDAQIGSIMAPLVVSKLTKFHWSKCSRKTIQENIPYFRCLKDRPHPKNFKFLDSWPGVYTTSDDQCKFVFGDKFEKCHYSIETCQRLWCRERSSCYTRSRPPLDGTYCAPGKWCMKGKCVRSNVPTTRPTPVNGKWSNWSAWTKCSRSCGIGIHFKTRKCNNPKPKHGGKDCVGEPTEREICNAHKCPITKNHIDIQDEQCKLFAGNQYSLLSDSMFENFFKSRMNTLDCTFQNGLCNWVQDSRDKFDWKVNKGRTPSSETGPKNDHKGNNDGRYMYIEASDNYGARRKMGDNAKLVSPEVAAPRACLKFYYHMYGLYMGSLKVIVRQTDGKETVVWKKSGNQGNIWFKADVSIESTKPYKIILEAVRGAHYTSDVSIDSLVFSAGLCKKEATVKTPCAVSCLSRNKKQFVLDKVVLDGTRCYNNRSHDICISGKCEVFGCDNVLGSTKVLDDCNVCGGDGSTCNAVEGTKDIVPKQSYEKILDLLRGSTNFVLEERQSSPYKIGIRIPGQVYLRKEDMVINIGSTTLYYANLKDGRQMISCTGPFDQNVEAVLYSGATTEKKTAKLSFKYFEKKTRNVYKYEVDRWESCSKSCDVGTQKAALKCVKNKRIDVDIRYCSHLKKNDIYRSCNVADCKTLRVVACVLQKLNKVVPNSVCPPPYPINWRYCNTQPCVTYEWSARSWGKCSVSCGGGLQMRIMDCVVKGTSRRIAFKYCNGKKSPAKVRECNLHQCDAFEYRTAMVGKCSRSCGGGIRGRIVNCVNKRTGARAGNLFCTGPPPPRIEKCNVQPCPHYEWNTEKFGACSQTCDGGERYRNVYCFEKRSKTRVDDSYCKTTKPDTSETCENPPCSSYLWDEGPWSLCDAVCGSGEQNRTVRCLMEGSRTVSPDSRCSITVNKPASTKSCRVKDCASKDSLSCNFDNNHFCNWNNEVGDDFNWKIGRMTPTLTTGPDKDHTTKNGRFAYIETSSPRLSRDRAILGSPMVNFKRGCFSFWYHMRGSGMGRLMVSLVNDNYRKTVFTRERNQGKQWRKATIRIPTDTPKGYKIVIVGEKGASFLSDIGLDDFQYTESDCPASCIERSPICGVVPMERYCHFPAFKKLCCETCNKRRPMYSYGWNYQDVKDEAF
eukprot:gene12673-13974_t